MTRLDAVGRVVLGHFPTPIEPLPRLSAHLGGPTILVKRDDATGLGLGGNKARKLEFLVAEALREGADTLVTVGGFQSNHCRQTAAAAARYGLACDLVLTAGHHSSPDFEANGNVLLDRLFGATLHWVGQVEDKAPELERVAAELRAAGRRPYVIPAGGSSPLGALGYAAGARELAAQLGGNEPACIVHSTGSGGTQAGLLLGIELAGRQWPVIGVSCGGRSAVLEAKISGLIRAAGDLVGIGHPASAASVVVDDGFVGPAYGAVTDGMLEAVALCARLEGLLLDPVYTGKAMAGLIAMIRRKRFGKDDTVLFLHTGGSPALFGYRGEIQAGIAGVRAQPHLSPPGA